MGKNFIGRQNDRQRGGREAVDSLILGDFGKGDKKFREIGNLTKWQGYIGTKVVQGVRIMEVQQTLPGYLKELRKSHHYKQDFVAAQLDIIRQTYSHYETGRITPPVKALCKLARLYEVPVESLLVLVLEEHVS